MKNYTLTILMASLFFFSMTSSIHSQSPDAAVLDFDGVNDGVDLPESSSLPFDANESFTIETWFKTETFHKGMLFSYQLCHSSSFDQLGRRAFAQQVDEAHHALQLDLTDGTFGNGVYLVTVVSQEGERMTQRLVVAK